MTLIEAAKQALDALEAHADIGIKSDKAITTLRTAIEQAEKQEPVAWANRNDLQNFDMRVRTNGDPMHTVPLYPTPPAAQRQWVGLTEKDFSAINQSCLTKLQAATSAESILKEKNT